MKSIGSKTAAADIAQAIREIAPHANEDEVKRFARYLAFRGLFRKHAPVPRARSDLLRREKRIVALAGVTDDLAERRTLAAMHERLRKVYLRTSDTLPEQSLDEARPSAVPLGETKRVEGKRCSHCGSCLIVETITRSRP